MRAIVINLFGGPCCGKSTVSAGLYYELKCMGVECELTGEYAKDKTWDDHQSVLKNQPYVFGKQLHRIWSLKDLYWKNTISIIISILYLNVNSIMKVIKKMVVIKQCRKLLKLMMK